MNKDELKSKHPETYAAVFEDGKAAGVAEGKATEHKRAKAHIKLGKSAGAVEVALEAIESGASVQDDEVFAAYQAAGMKRREQSARQDDDKAASEAADKSKSSASGGSSTSKADSDAQVVADIVTGKRSAEVA